MLFILKVEFPLGLRILSFHFYTNLMNVYYCKYCSQGIVVFLVSNGHVESELLIDYFNRSQINSVYPINIGQINLCVNNTSHFHFIFPNPLVHTLLLNNTGPSNLLCSLRMQEYGRAPFQILVSNSVHNLFFK